MNREKSAKELGRLRAKVSKESRHETMLREHFSGRTDYTGEAPVFEGPLILLAFMNRSGSNLLGEYLTSTGSLLGFKEQLNQDIVRTQAARLGVDNFPDYVKTISRHGIRQKLSYGFKASWNQIIMLSRWGIPKMYDGVRVIHIARREVVAQAVSFSIAGQTKEWTSRQQSDAAEVEYNFEDIEKKLESVLLSNECIPYICWLLQYPMLRVDYEDLIADPRPVMQKIGEFLGHDFSQWVPPADTLQRQASSRNEQFATRFREDARREYLRVP